MFGDIPDPKTKCFLLVQYHGTVTLPMMVQYHLAVQYTLMYSTPTNIFSEIQVYNIFIEIQVYRKFMTNDVFLEKKNERD